MRSRTHVCTCACMRAVSVKCERGLCGRWSMEWDYDDGDNDEKIDHCRYSHHCVLIPRTTAIFRRCRRRRREIRRPIVLRSFSDSEGERPTVECGPSWKAVDSWYTYVYIHGKREETETKKKMKKNTITNSTMNYMGLWTWRLVRGRRRRRRTATRSNVGKQAREKKRCEKKYKLNGHLLN